MGEGAWQQTTEPRKPPIAASVTNVRRRAHALMTEPTSLTAALPRVEIVEIEKLGHMGPVTHPEPVNAMIEEYFERI